ncbi:MAG: zinc-ribbon domain-containing protein, partial [Oscillospiraceae bacterium]|nr:zinc-ribbon domain-containing protein [Oscillospiraceae bacterium]
MAKYCTNCGNALREGAKFCQECGSAVTPVAAPKPAPEPQ